ncbi:MAG TPA: RluA family pseudouridine synthase [Candidatus Dojkabacteria bacterium]|nr:RluA family pseudouridine synthase [Candidatus Dojkabacteria bacterium]
MSNTDNISLIVDSVWEGERLDVFLLDKLSEYIPSAIRPIFNRSQILKYLGLVTVNGESQKKGYKVKVGDVVLVDIKSLIDSMQVGLDERSSLVSENGVLTIIEESDDWMVINKPKGIVVHPGEGNWKGTLANYVKGYLEGKGEYDERVERAGIVHRLDKGVSGLMIIAKNLETQLFLKKQFEEHKVVKVYRASVIGDMSPKVPRFNGNVEDVIRELEKNKYNPKGWYELAGYIGRDSRNRQKMRFSQFQVDSTYKSAMSYILRIEDGSVLIKIETGRMHQIRASLKFLGVSIIGDSLYGSSGVGDRDALELEAILLGLEVSPGVKRQWRIV